MVNKNLIDTLKKNINLVLTQIEVFQQKGRVWREFYRSTE